MQEDPLISVIVPAYNAAETIRQCLDALETQTLPRESYEIIVIDNNSRDETGAIVRSYPGVQYLIETVQGSASARNTGIRQARGRVIAFTDSDCVPSSAWLERISAGILSGEADVCGGEVEPVSVDKEIERFGKVWFWPIRQIIKGELFHYPYVITANAAYLAELVRKVGGFDPEFPVAGYEDTDLGWRSYFAGARFGYVPDAIVLHHHRTTLKGLFYMGYKGAFGREILIEKFSSKGIPATSLPRAAWQLVRYAVWRTFRKSHMHDKRRWAVYEFTFRAGQLWGSFKGKAHIRSKPVQSRGDSSNGV